MSESDRELLFKDRQPNYIEFLRIDNDTDMELVAKRFLGEEATSTVMLNNFNVDLTNFVGFYGEVGTADTPVGPMRPAKVKPILGIKMAEDGNGFVPMMLKSKGFVTTDGKRAWVKIKEWDKVTGDDLGDRIQEAKDIAEEYGPEVAPDLTIPEKYDGEY